MTGRPTRATIAGRAYLDLRSLARRQGRPTDELHQIYALEGFLARLAGSPHASRLILKGGVLLAALDARRPTRDVDLLARALPNETDDVLALVRDIAALPFTDGLTLFPRSASADTIREADTYSGVRVTLTGELAAAHLTFHVDVNVGDPVWPAPQPVVLPRLLSGHIELLGYPLPMVCAEKIVTAIQRGTANTRWRDFADLYLLTGRHDIDGHDLQRAITTVANHRHVTIRPLADVLDDFAALAQARWAIWRRRYGLDDRLPTSFANLLDAVITFTDPVLSRDAPKHYWASAQRTSSALRS